MMMMMMMMKSLTSTNGLDIDPVCIRGVCVVPRLLEPRNCKLISFRSKDISNFSNITMNDSIRQKKEKSSKRIKQRELKDNHRQIKPKSQSLTTKGSLKYQRRHDESRQEGKNENEFELKSSRSLPIKKSAYNETDTPPIQKSGEKKTNVFHKKLLKPIAYQDPALLQLRAEKQKQRAVKTLLQKQNQEIKIQQRREIYALNAIMKKLEHTEFKEFCHIAGIHPEE